MLPLLTPRPDRTLWYFVYEAAAGRELFPADWLYDVCKERAHSALTFVQGALHGYWLMQRELHLIISIGPDKTVADFAQSFAHAYARKVNEVTHLKGHVYAEKFRAWPLSTPEALAQEVRMLCWLPVWRGLCETPLKFCQSGLRVFLGLATPNGLDVKPIQTAFGETPESARAAMRPLIAQRPSDEEMQTWAATRHLGTRGSASNDIRAGRDALFAIGEGNAEHAIELLELWISSGRGLALAELRESSTSVAAHARALVGCLATRHGLSSGAALARRYGRSKATLNEQMNRCRKEAADRKLLATPVAQILEEVSASTRKADVAA